MAREEQPWKLTDEDKIKYVIDTKELLTSIMISYYTTVYQYQLIDTCICVLFQITLL